MISEKNLINKISENGIHLLGQIDISENEFQELIGYSRIVVRNISPAYGVRCDLRLAVTMVQIAIRDYKEGRYWVYFCDALGEQLSTAKTNHCGKVFVATVKKYGLLYIDGGNSQMYVENIKMHAIVTNYYMSGFWDFLYSYYEKNLFRQLSDEIDEDIELLSMFMKSTLNDNSDSFVGEEGKGHAAKSYKLLKATRNLLANNDIQTNIDILMPQLTLIDNYYYDSTVSYDANRFCIYFSEWCKEKEKIEDKTEKKKRNRLLASKRPYIHYDLGTMMAFLYIPSQKFRENEFEDEASVTISINGYEKTMELEIYKSFGIYISEPKRIPIPSIFDEINISVESSVIKKYRILASNYRILNKNQDVINKLAVGNNTIIVEKRENVFFEGQTTCIDYSDEYLHFDFYSIDVSDDSVLHIGKRTVSLVGEYSEIPYFEDEISDFEVLDGTEKKLIVTRSHPTISFVVSKMKKDGTVLLVNETKYPLVDIADKVICSNVNNDDLVVAINLEETLPNIDGSFDVCIDIPDEKNKVIPKYVRLSKLEIYFSKSIFSAFDDVYVWVRNGNGVVWPERDDVTLVGMHTNADEYVVPILDNESNMIFELELNEAMKIVLPLYIFKAGFSQDELTFYQPEYIWYSDLKETIYCSAPDCSEVRIHLNHDKDKYIKGIPLGKNVFRFDIAELKQNIINNPFEGWHYLNVLCIGSRRRSFRLYSVLRVLWVEPFFDFKLIDGCLGFDLQVNGNAELYIDIEDEYSKEKLVEKKIITSGVTLFPELDKRGIYNIFPKMIESDDFGLSENVFSMRHLYKQSYVGLDDLVDYRLTIADLLYYDEKLSLSYDYNIDVRNKVSTNIYEGYMHGFKKASRHKADYKGKYELAADGKPIKKKFGKVRIEIIEEDEKCIYIQLLTSTYDEVEEGWIELYYDNSFKTLLHCNDNALNQYGGYDRYEFLGKENTRYRIMKKKIRRLRFDVI